MENYNISIILEKNNHNVAETPLLALNIEDNINMNFGFTT